ncbi:MAG: hypothetical protein OHK0046_26430 [Anaerolineae bacterium]
MANKKNKRQNKVQRKNNQQMMLLGIVGVAVIAVIAAVVLFSPSGETNDDAVVQPGLISPVQYQTQLASADHFLLDVRTPEEFAQGHIAGAVNIPVDALSSYLSEIPTDKPVVLYCRSGNRSATAADILADAGYSDVYDIDGGVIAWTRQNLPLQ